MSPLRQCGPCWLVVLHIDILKAQRRGMLMSVENVQRRGYIVGYIKLFSFKKQNSFEQTLMARTRTAVDYQLKLLDRDAHEAQIETWEKRREREEHTDDRHLNTCLRGTTFWNNGIFSVIDLPASINMLFHRVSLNHLSSSVRECDRVNSLMYCYIQLTGYKSANLCGEWEEVLRNSRRRADPCSYVIDLQTTCAWVRAKPGMYLMRVFWMY